MSKLLRKFGLGLATYWHAKRAMTRQFTPENIISVQSEKLRRLVRYCFDVKYYRELFANVGIKPEDITSVQDLPKIPFLTKEELRGRFWDFLPRQLPSCRVSRTSGSTGIPVCILSDRNSRMFNSAAVIRYRQALGIGLIGRPILTPLKTENDPHREAHWTFLQGIHKTHYINPYLNSNKNVEYAARLLKKLKKPAIVGITPAIRALAYRVRDGLFPAFDAGAVLTSGETLTPKVRLLLESTFGATVTDVYNCNEAGDVAWQCRRAAGYHINADNVIVEVVRDNRQVPVGEVGEVVITNLNRYAMPVIRYKNGDLARLTGDRCPCGCRLPMIAEIVGRTGEDIFLPDGRMMPWNQLKSMMNHPHIRQFQLVQDADGSFTVRYVAEQNVDGGALATLLLARYRDLLGTEIRITVDKVDNIPPAPSGKSKLVVSKYKPKDQAPRQNLPST